MKKIENAHRGEPSQSPTDWDLLKNPLEFIEEEHLHMRAICEILDKIADAKLPDIVMLSKAIRFVEHEVGILIEDEDADLRSLLLERCTSEDDIEATLDRLEKQHEELAAQLPSLLDALCDLREKKRKPTTDQKTLLQSFATDLRRHLILENAIVRPFAKARLTEDDLAKLRGGMIRRRLGTIQS